jgi:NAD-dependent DNA ligase
MKNPIARYLMCAYAYYVEDDPLIPDTEFDELSKYILKNYEAIDHPHKEYITKSDLEAGTYLGQYPSMVKGAVKSYRDELVCTASGFPL